MLSSRSIYLFLHEQVKSRVRLFADDTTMYLVISSTTESEDIQTDLACIEQWEKMMWNMQLTLLNVRSFKSQKAKPFNASYILHNVECFRSKISRAHHCRQTLMDQIYRHHYKNGNQTLSFLARGVDRGHVYGGKGAGSGVYGAGAGGGGRGAGKRGR